MLGPRRTTSLRPNSYTERDAPCELLRGEGTHTDYVLTNTEW